MIRIEFAIQENMKRIIICDKLKFISTFPSILRKNSPARGFWRIFKGNGLTKLAKKMGTKKKVRHLPCPPTTSTFYLS